MTRRKSASVSAPRAVAVEHHPLLVELADVVADVRRVPDVGEGRILAEQHHLGADHVRDLVLHRPARAVGRALPLLVGEVGADGADVGPHLLQPVDQRFVHDRER